MIHIDQPGVMQHRSLAVLLVTCGVLSWLLVLCWHPHDFRQTPFEVVTENPNRAGEKPNGTTEWSTAQPDHYETKPTPKNTKLPSPPAKCAHVCRGSGVHLCTCAMEDRARRLRASCRSTPLDPGSPSRPMAQTVQYTITDNVHKAVWILVPKAGSRSWLRYFALGVGGADGHSILGDLEGYRKLGVDFHHNLKVSEINNRYRAYVKFVVVRHPLQKFVSAYFEVVVKREKFTTSCRRIRRLFSTSSAASCDREPIITFTEFALAFASGELPENEHWRAQYKQTRACHIQLDLIIKSEVDKYDVRMLSKKLGVAARDVSRLNQGIFNTTGKDSCVTDLTRYDNLLRELDNTQPSTFRWLLDYFSPDLELFGYTWNAVEGRSGCQYGEAGCC